MKNKRIILALIIIVIIAAITLIAYFFLLKKNGVEIIKNREEQLTQCLDETQEVSYDVKEKEAPLVDVIVFINDKSIKKEIRSFRIENVFKTSTSIEVHKCGIYVIKEFNFDFEKFKPLPGFSVELWRYT